MLDRNDISLFRGAQLADYRGREIGYLFQEFELLDNMTARENIILPLSLHGMTGRQAEDVLQMLACRLDIVGALDEFSVTDVRRTKAACGCRPGAYITDPSIVLADEPTGALDSKNSRILMDKLAAINEEQHKTIVMVTHDANAASYCSRILFIQDGRLFHELRKNPETESTAGFYERIVTVMARLGGGSANVL